MFAGNTCLLHVDVYLTFDHIQGHVNISRFQQQLFHYGVRGSGYGGNMRQIVQQLENIYYKLTGLIEVTSWRFYVDNRRKKRHCTNPP